MMHEVIGPALMMLMIVLGTAWFVHDNNDKDPDATA